MGAVRTEREAAPMQGRPVRSAPFVCKEGERAESEIVIVQCTKWRGVGADPEWFRCLALRS